MNNNYNWYCNKECKYYPCHQLLNCYDELNCMFCFCPLYRQSDCGGNYETTPQGIKDCSNCTMPHHENSYQYIMSKLKRDLHDM